MFCTKCGARNEDGARFCTSCGAPMAGVESSAGAAGPQEAPATSQPQPAPQPGPVPASTTPATPAAPKKKGSGVKGIIVAAVLFVVAFGAGFFITTGSLPNPLGDISLGGTSTEVSGDAPYLTSDFYLGMNAAELEEELGAYGFEFEWTSSNSDESFYAYFTGSPDGMPVDLDDSGISVVAVIHDSNRASEDDVPESLDEASSDAYVAFVTVNALLDVEDDEALDLLCDLGEAEGVASDSSATASDEEGARAIIERLGLDADVEDVYEQSATDDAFYSVSCVYTQKLATWSAAVRTSDTPGASPSLAITISLGE